MKELDRVWRLNLLTVKKSLCAHARNVFYFLAKDNRKFFFFLSTFAWVFTWRKTTNYKLKKEKNEIMGRKKKTYPIVFIPLPSVMWWKGEHNDPQCIEFRSNVCVLTVLFYFYCCVCRIREYKLYFVDFWRDELCLTLFFRLPICNAVLFTC